MKRPILLFCVFLLAAGCGPGRKDPVDYVNPYAGNISHLLVPTFPTVQLPTGAGGMKGFSDLRVRACDSGKILIFVYQSAER